MKAIEDLFDLHRARSGLFSQYRPGDVPYVGNGMSHNAVVGFVTPRDGDRVFRTRSIVVSAFAEATVQVPPFIACGRAGNGLIVLEPKAEMPLKQLAAIAAYINLAVRWRFNWYRQTTVDRIKRLTVPSTYSDDLDFDIAAALPAQRPAPRPAWTPTLKPFTLDEIFELVSGEHHSIGHFPAGKTPIISCGDANNGVAGYYRVGGPLYVRKMTISLNGQNTLTAKYHPYEFAAKDDVAICTPRTPLRLSTILFVQMMLNRERWRYSYYRKCFLDKLRRFSVSLPAKDGRLDEDEMQRVMQGSPYWKFLEEWSANERDTPSVQAMTAG